jgi:hypothetical protein
MFIKIKLDPESDVGGAPSNDQAAGDVTPASEGESAPEAPESEGEEGGESESQGEPSGEVVSSTPAEDSAAKLKFYEENKDIFDSYSKFEEALAKDADLKATIQGAIQDYVAKKNGVSKDQVNQNKPAEQPAQPVPQLSPEAQVLQLRQEIALKDYVSQFTQEISADNIADEDKEDFFRETYLEASKLDPNALLRFNPNLIKQSVDVVRKRWERITRNKNQAYAATKAKDKAIPPPGSGSAPVKEQPKVMSRDQATSYIAEGLRAGK